MKDEDIKKGDKKVGGFDVKSTTQSLFFYIKWFGLFAIVLVLGYSFIFVTWKVSDTMHTSASHRLPKRNTGITKADSISLKLWGDYQIDLQQNYIRFQDVVLYPKQNMKILHLWALYPTREGFSATKAAIFKEDYADDEVVRIAIYRISEDDQRKMKQHGRDGVKGILEYEKNYQLTPEELQPFLNPKEYVDTIIKSTYFYIYDSGDHVVYISCGSTSFNFKFHAQRCSAKKMWNHSIGILFNFGISNLTRFGHIEKMVDQLLQDFNLRKIKHD